MLFSEENPLRTSEEEIDLKSGFIDVSAEVTSDEVTSFELTSDQSQTLLLKTNTNAVTLKESISKLVSFFEGEIIKLKGVRGVDETLTSQVRIYHNIYDNII